MANKNSLITGVHHVINKAFDILTQNNSLYQDYTLDLSDFAAAMNTMEMQFGKEKFFNAVTTVLLNTVIRSHHFRSDFDFIETDAETFGSYDREIDYYDTIAMELGDRIHDKVNEDGAYTQVDPEPFGDSNDPFQITQVTVPFQINVTGQQGYAEELQRKTKEFYACFRSAEEMGAFMSGMMEKFKRDVQLRKEASRRALFSRYAMGLYDAGWLPNDTDDAWKNSPKPMAVNLVQQFCVENHSDMEMMTVSQVLDNGEYAKEFAQWFSIWYKQLIREMETPNIKHHVYPDKKYHDRLLTHTVALENPKLVMNAKFYDTVKTYVLSEVFNEKDIELPKAHTVAFWNEPDSPLWMEVKYRPLRKDAIRFNMATQSWEGTGELVEIEPVSRHMQVLGVLYDDKACKMVTQSISSNAWENPRTGTLFYKEDYVMRNVVDYTRPAMLFYLEDYYIDY